MSRTHAPGQDVQFTVGNSLSRPDQCPQPDSGSEVDWVALMHGPSVFSSRLVVQDASCKAAEAGFLKDYLRTGSFYARTYVRIVLYRKS